MKFDSKTFNPTVFGRYVERVPKLRKNELLKSGALVVDEELASMLPAQTGGNYITIPIYGLIGGDALNYDGETDLTCTTDDTYEQSFVVIGRMKGFKEKDFSREMTGKDFMDNVASQVSSYWEDVEQDLLLSVLKGIFSMTNPGADADFVKKHTYEIATPVTATTLNNATQKACGDNKDKFSMVIMHSQVATTLENLQLLEFLKYTDAQGIERNMNIAQWGSKVVLIDDTMPVADGKYTSYVLGLGAIITADCGAKVPYEMHRDPVTSGGEEMLYTRNRRIIAPRGISFTKASMAKKSPTNAELEMGNNWTLVNNGEGKAIDDKAILICRIISVEETV